MTISTWIGFDADDTLWDTEIHYIRAKDRFAELLSGCVLPEIAWARLDKIESYNVQIYGYGVKSFALSMIEAAVNIAGEYLNHAIMQNIIQITKEMLEPDTTPDPDTIDLLETLHQKFNLILITKGELLEQGLKIKRSGVERYFDGIEIVNDKTTHVYLDILSKYQIEPERFIMVGNSIRSDILPVIEIGGWAIYVPHPLTWSHEVTPGAAVPTERFFEIDQLRGLPGILSRIN